MIVSTISAERKKLRNEITPVSAEQSRTEDNNEASYGAHRGIDGNQATAAYISKGSDRVAWYKVRFDGLKCIDQVTVSYPQLRPNEKRGKGVGGGRR